MKNLPSKKCLLAVSAMTALVSCGGGGDGADAVTASAVSVDTKGQVINNYISGATVTLDINDDGICDASEPHVTTSVTGNYEFKAQGTHMVCASGGTNSVTGLAFVGRLVAPAQATVVTPLTTLIVAQARSKLTALVQGKPAPLDASLVAAAQAAIMAQLNLQASVPVLTTDPVALMNKAGATAADARLEQINAAAQVLLQQIAQAIIASANLPTPASADAVTEAFNAAVAGFQATLDAAGAVSVDFNTASTAATRKLIAEVASKASAAAKANPALLKVSPQFGVLSPANVAAAIAATPLADTVKAVASASAASLSSRDGAERAALASTQITDAVQQVAALLTEQADAGAASVAAIDKVVAKLAPVDGSVVTKAEVDAAINDAINAINNALPTGGITIPLLNLPRG